MTGGPLVFLDFETRSRVDLKLHGGRRYVEDDSTEQLCGVAAVVRTVPGCSGPGYVTSLDVYGWAPWPGPVGVWRCAPPRPGSPFDAIAWHPCLTDSDDPPPEVIAAAREGVAIAHNADGFDRHVWDGLGLPPVQWQDTFHLARRRGLPVGLQRLGEQLYGMGKDDLGAKIMREHSTPKPATKSAPAGRFRDPAPASLTAILRYCARDVLLLVGAYLDENLGAPHHDDQVLAAHRAIDDRGVPIDLELVWKFRSVASVLVKRAEETARRHGVTATMLRSSDKRKGLLGWLAKQGVELPDLTGRTVKDALRRKDLAPDVREVLEARLTVARVTTGKLDALLNTTQADGRLRGSLVYWGAHTGRWAGKGAQLHNFPRPNEDAPAPEELARDVPRLPDAEAAELLVRLAAQLKTTAPALLGGLLRLVVRAPSGRQLVTLDFSAIEGRGLLWVAGDEEGLEVYRTGGDPYRVMASKVFGTPVTDKKDPRRQVGKVAVLACGYQGGAVALERYAIKAGVDLAAAGVTPAQVVEAWRDAHPLVAGRRTGRTKQREDGSTMVFRRGGLWRELADAAWTAVATGSVVHAGRCVWYMDGPHLICELPSGRPGVYRDARIEEVTTKWGKTRDAVTFASAKKGGLRQPLYGGLITENVVQALCRDLLAGTLVRLEAEGPRLGLRTVLHVHDEVVVEADAEDEHALEHVRELAEVVPPWAAGFPIKAEGAAGERWGK